MWSMPECFKPNYMNSRVIIDCTEFSVSQKSITGYYMLFELQESFTAKLLIGITPSGCISFKSEVAGGRKSDSQLTVESGLIELLEEGDSVLADTGL
ncbi:hypothetical protein JTB14_005672 [Gonioctena quinquepunctata]|nr:hypothetical protein JTB14_005672 [Gonioctena quinquepunctata]